ncbi:MAG: BBP7 family outer membrane beta-barrel protein [Planctomycetota bacterium]
MATAQQQPYAPVVVNAAPTAVAYGPVVNTAGALDPYARFQSPSFGFPDPGAFLRQTVGERLWLRGEYLYWQVDGMEVPALVTSSPIGTPQSQAGVLGQSGTTIRFGSGEFNEGGTSGYRVSGGFWVTPNRAFGIGAEYFDLMEQDDGFSASGDGSSILARPLFDITSGNETSQLISFPGFARGSIAITSESDLRSFLINGRAALCPQCQGTCGCPTGDRVDWIVGYRYLELDDRLRLRENVTSLVTAEPGSISLDELFRAENRFNGLQLGVAYQSRFERFWLESSLRVAVGNMNQQVSIEGNSIVNDGTTTTGYTGALLAQRTNIGNYERDEFTMIPEIGLQAGIRLTDWLHANVGYTLLYLPNVVRAGHQIDTDVNPGLFPPETDPLTGALRPRFSFRQDDFLAHGLSVGAQVQF